MVAVEELFVLPVTVMNCWIVVGKSPFGGVTLQARSTPTEQHAAGAHCFVRNTCGQFAGVQDTCDVFDIECLEVILSSDEQTQRNVRWADAKEGDGRPFWEEGLPPRSAALPGQ